MSGSNRSNDSYPPAASPACERVRLALSEYVDGALSDPEAKQIQAHLEVCSPCLELVAGFKRVQAVCETPPDLPETDFWSSISQTLQSDRQVHADKTSFSPLGNAACGFDPEFIFAYLDGEPVDTVENTDTELERFESHLFACMPCNEQIADADALSMLLKDWHYRLEDRLEVALQPLSLPESVLAQYQQDGLDADTSAFDTDFENDALAHQKPCDVMTWETLSSFLDAELPDAEMRSVKSHLAACQPCTSVLNAYQSAQMVYQNWSQRLETCAPDLRPQIMQAYQSLEAATEPSANKVLQGPTGWFNKKSSWLALPSIAAAVLLLVMTTRTGFFTVGQSQESARLAESGASSEAPMAEMDANSTSSFDPDAASVESSTLSQASNQSPLASEASQDSTKEHFSDQVLKKEQVLPEQVSAEQVSVEGKVTVSETSSVSLPARTNRASGNVIAAAPPPGAPSSPFVASAPKQAPPAKASMEMEADRQYADASPAAIRSAEPSEKASKSKKDQRERDGLKQADSSRQDKNEARLALGGSAAKGSGQPTARKQRSPEKIAYIPSAEEYLYAQHSRSIYSHEMSAMMGGEGSP